MTEIKVKIGADTSELSQGLSQAERGMGRLGRIADKTARGLDSFGDTATKLGQGLTAVTAGFAAAGAAAFAMTKDVAAAGDAAAKAARGAGVSGEYFQEMSFAMGQVAAISEGELAAGMTRVTRMLGDAQGGSKSAIAAFERIGISQSAIASGAVNTETAFDALVQTLSDAKDPAIAAAISTELLGRSGADLGPKLAGSADAMADLRKRAQELGVVMSQDALDASEAFGDKLDEVEKGFQGLKVAIANELLPVFVNVLLPAMNEKVIPALQSVARSIGQVIDWFSNLPAPVQEAAGAIGVALGAGGPILLGVGLVSKAIGALIAASGPIGLFIAAASLLAAAWTVWGDDIKTIVGGAVEYIAGAFTTAFEAVKGFGSSTMDAVRGALTFVKDQFNAFLTFVQGIPEQLMLIGQQMIQGLLDGIMLKWEELKAKIYELGEMLPMWMREMLDIQSPSRVFHEIGMFVGEGLANGIADAQGMVEASVNAIGDAATQSTQGMVTSILGSMSQLFTKSKPLAIATALMNTWQGMTEALKLPFPKNLAAAAATLATGMNAVRNIKSTTPGGGGGTSASSGSAGRAGSESGGGQQAQQPVTTFQFTLTNDPFGFGENFARQFIDQLNRTSANGGQIRGVIA